MIFTFPHTRFTLISAILACLILVSCQKQSELDIPSYIAIDTISLDVTADQGTASNKIIDAWVYTGNDLEGAFELPASFPVLKSGNTVLHIQPGIKLNGISETRAPYPFYDTISIVTSLSRETVSDLGHLKAKYKSGTVFEWMEDFEDPYLTLDTTARSSYKINRVGDPALASAFPGEGNSYAGKVVVDSETKLFECTSHNSFTFSNTLPEEKSYVFLELNYKTNVAFTVGLFIYGTQTVQQDVLVINPTNTWNKIYINLTPTISTNTDASKFKVYFKATKQEGAENSEIYLDNIKLLHF